MLTNSDFILLLFFSVFGLSLILFFIFFVCFWKG